MPFDLQPTLRGRLIELRPLRADDFDALYSVAKDPLIWEQHPNRDRYQEDVFRQFFAEAIASGGALVAFDVSSGNIIGSSRFNGYDAEKGEIEIGWTFLARSHWGGAHNGEMKQLMLHHAFQFVERVIFVIGPENFRSRKAVEKIGGTLMPGRLAPHGGNSVVYQITAATFAKRMKSGASTHPG
jgi:RimJ/RimL family protein N-acetyltransferase